MQTTETTTAGNGLIIWPDYSNGGTTVTYPWQWSYVHPEPPRVCSGDVHVFACPHCDKCRCGAAVKKGAKK